MNISKWDKKVQIIPNIFFSSSHLTLRTRHYCARPMLEIENKNKKKRFLPVRTLLTYIHTYIQIIEWQAGGFLSSFFLSIFCFVLFTGEPYVIVWDRVTFTRKWRRMTTDTSVWRGGGDGYKKKRRRKSVLPRADVVLSLSAPPRGWLWEQRAVRDCVTCGFKCCVQVQSGGSRWKSAVQKRKRESLAGKPSQSNRTRLLMQRVLLFRFVFLF